MLFADFAGLLDCCLAIEHFFCLIQFQARGEKGTWQTAARASLHGALPLHREACADCFTSLSPLLRQPSLLGAVSLFADVEMRCRDSKLCRWSQLVPGGSEFAPRPVWPQRPHLTRVGPGLFPPELHSCLLSISTGEVGPVQSGGVGSPAGPAPCWLWTWGQVTSL